MGGGLRTWAEPGLPGLCLELGGRLSVRRKPLLGFGQITSGIQEANEALRNSAGLGSWVVFLAYFRLGSAFPKHPPTLTAQAGPWGSSALGSFWEGVTFPPGGDPASYTHTCKCHSSAPT